MVDGAALGRGGGGGVGQLDVLGDVAAGEPHGAVTARGGETAIGVDTLNGPGGPVADHLPPVGDQLAVVAAGGDLVTDIDPGRAGLDGSAGPGRVRRRGCAAVGLAG